MLTRIIKKVEPPPEPTRIYDKDFDPDGLIMGILTIPHVSSVPVILTQPNGMGATNRFIWISLLDGRPVSSYYPDLQFAMMWAFEKLECVYHNQYNCWGDIIDFINRFIIQAHLVKVV